LIKFRARIISGKLWPGLHMLSLLIVLQVFSKIKLIKIAYLFVIVSAVQMTLWALDKHAKYKQEFNGQNGTEKYPENRKAIFPWIL